MTELLNKYEAMIVFDPNLGEEETAKKLAEMKDLLAEAGGEVWHEDVWGIRDMSYKVAGQSRGYYVVINFNLLPGKLKKADKHLTLEKSAMRYMIIRVPDNYQPVTLEQYILEAEKEEAERSEARKQEAEPVKKTKLTKIPVETVEKVEKVETAPEVVEPVEEAAEEEAEKVTEKTPDKKEQQKKELDDLDAKLQSIINDPDIIL